MNILREIQFRWTYGAPSLPGEIQELPIEDGRKLRIVSMFLLEPDKERRRLLRRFRGLLGYGQGWTFKEALMQRLMNVVLWAVALFVVALFIITVAVGLKVVL